MTEETKANRNLDEALLNANSQIEVLVQRNKELKEALEKADCMFQQIEDNVKKIPYYQEESDYFSRLDNIWKCISQAINQDKWRIK